MARIDTVGARNKLTPRHEPYWVRLSSGCMLGFRKLTATSTGTWIARYRAADTGRRDKRSLGDFSDRTPTQRFDEAKKAAESWFEHLGKGGASEKVTVRVACERYVTHVRARKGDRTADEVHQRFARWVFSDITFAQTELSRLTKARLELWRNAIAKTPAKVNRDKREVPLTRPRSASTVNRDMTALRAALNFAYDAGSLTSDSAWRVALRPAKNVDGRRYLYFDRTQRRALIAHAQKDLALFLEGLCLVPLRPGALAALKVAHFDTHMNVLTVGKDKAGQDRRIQLPPSTGAFFAHACAEKPAGAPIFCRGDGHAWTKESWRLGIMESIHASGLPRAATAYTLRHSVITDLVTGGLDLLTVAQLSGTSVVMIERHYGHFRAHHAAAALAALTL